jgi:hypothetical protein
MVSFKRVTVECEIFSARFKILLNSKNIFGQIGLPILERSLRPHVTVCATERSRHRLRVKHVCAESIAFDIELQPLRQTNTALIMRPDI